MRSKGAASYVCSCSSFLGTNAKGAPAPATAQGWHTSSGSGYHHQMHFLQPSTTQHLPWLFQVAPGRLFESTGQSGKWCVYRTTDGIDTAWRVVRALVTNDILLAAKVSTRQAVDSGGHGQHVICVYTPDSQDWKEVLRVREVLRAAGFEGRLQYRRDADTMAGIDGFVYEA